MLTSPMTDVRQIPINMCHTTVEIVGVAAHVMSCEKFPIKSTRRRQRTPRRRKTVGQGPAFDRKWTPERYSSWARGEWAVFVVWQAGGAMRSPSDDPAITISKSFCCCCWNCKRSDVSDCISRPSMAYLAVIK